jgi:hypothetical protein
MLRQTSDESLSGPGFLRDRSKTTACFKILIEKESEMRTHSRADPNPKIQALLRRIEESRSALAEERVRDQRRIERDLNRLALIVGGVLVREGDESPEFRAMLIRILIGSSLTDSDKRFLAERGWWA